MMLEVDVLYIKQIEQTYLPKLRKLLYILATTSPCAPNVSQLSIDIETSRATVMNYIKYLTDARLINMGKSQAEEKDAVACGYWHLWRYNPELEAEGKNPFTLDSKEPDWSKFKDFLKGEVRFASVMKQYPSEAETLFQAAEDNAKWRLNSYKRLANQQWISE